MKYVVKMRDKLTPISGSAKIGFGKSFSLSHAGHAGVTSLVLPRAEVPDPKRDKGVFDDTLDETLCAVGVRCGAA